MKIAINGFGRIGRSLLRILLAEPSTHAIEVVAINLGHACYQAAAHLFKYDTVYGTYSGRVSLNDTVLQIDDIEIPLYAECNPIDLPWKEYGVEWVIEASGVFTDGNHAKQHITAGAQKVLITAPAKNIEVTIIPGINDEAYRSEYQLVSLGSCTTNAFMPIIELIHKRYGIVSGLLTTIHAYTTTQSLLDREHPDLRRARAAAVNIIPTSTGAAKLVGSLFPELAEKIDACAVRVPIDNVSLLDFTCVAGVSVSISDINSLFAHAATGRLSGIVGVSDEPLVSSDFKGRPESVIIDTLLTQQVGTMIKIFGWYDNEWGYSMRIKDFLTYVV